MTPIGLVNFCSTVKYLESHVHTEARLGPVKDRLSKFGSGAWSPCKAKRRHRAAKDFRGPELVCPAPFTFTTILGARSIRHIWLFLLKLGIAVPNNQTEWTRSVFGLCGPQQCHPHYEVSCLGRTRHFVDIEHDCLNDSSTDSLNDLGARRPSLHGLYSPSALVFGYLILGKLFGAMATPGGGGIPLHEFRKDVPPGWAPGIPDYPLRLFFERLKLWYSVYDGDDTMVGPLVAGRLQGKAQRLGMQLRLPRPDGGVDVGSDALVRLSIEEVRDPYNPSVVLQQHCPSGVQALCNSLRAAFGVSDQEMVSRSIEDFMEFRRGKLSFSEYAVEWEIRLEEATARAGFEVNEVAKFYLFFRNSGLPAKLIEDIKLQVQGDMRRFIEAKTLALRLVNRGTDAGAELYVEENWNDENYFAEDWDEYDWTEDGWSWAEDFYQDESQEYDEDFWPPDEGWESGGNWDSWSGYGDDADDTSASAVSGGGGLQAAASERDGDGNVVEGNYPVKGKGKGIGCSICGSRWHTAPSCPVNNSGSGSGKGSGFRPYKGKGYGSSKGFGKGKKGKKGKGKSRWTPRGKGSSGRKGYGYYGYVAEKTLRSCFGEPRQLTPPVKTKAVHFQLDADDEVPVIALGGVKAIATTEKSDNEEPNGSDPTATSSSTASGTSNPVVKRLDFSFATSIYSDHAAFHTVKGEKRRGLLVDPGAASGLIGSETLRDLLEHCALPTGKQVSWRYDKQNSVSGISGTQEATLGEVSIPVQLAGATGSFSADVIGGEGSLCPALLSNPALRKQRASILTDWFSNGDGVLATWDDNHGWHYMRMLLTDSGHYLLPVDDAREVSEETTKKANKQLYLWAAETSQQWNDVRHCFLQGCPSRECERYPSYPSATSTPKSTPSSLQGVQCESRDSHEPSASTTADTTATSCATSNDAFTPTPASATTSPASTTKYSTKPFLGDPPARKERDTWTVEGSYLIRHHRTPRRMLFTPPCAIDCPIDPTMVLGDRITEIRAVGKKTVLKVLKDDWICGSNSNKDLEYLWTGKTKFRLLQRDATPVTTPEPLQAQPSSSPSTANQAASETHYLDPEAFPAYDGDHFPEHWSAERTKQAQQYYRAIPEEFYTKSGRRPVTPRNAREWLQQARGKELRFQFWEWCSGSGRLSLMLLLANFVVGFPVDYRYGWDLGHAGHQKLLHECQQSLLPAHLFAAPNRGPWSIASAGKDPAKRSFDRAAELPTLEFIFNSASWQHHHELGFTIEQPTGSAMYRDSPVARLTNMEGVGVQRLDQCMLGAQDEHQNPIRKATTFLSNRKWKVLIKRCSGHKGRPHGVLQGQCNGCNRTTLAAVYPKRLCHAFGQDLWRLLRADQLHTCKPWPRTLFWLHGFFYSCEKCRLGRAAPPGCEHSLAPGECRYGQPGVRGVPSARTTRQPRPTLSDLEDPTGPFKFLAKSGDYSMIRLAVDASLQITDDNQLYLKAALMQLVESCLDLFAKEKSVHSDHWVEDPILLRVFQDVFLDTFQVLGVLCSLRPWTRKVPDPYLSSSAAPLRLLVDGALRSWQVHAVEDMRLMGHSQLHAPVDEADWHIHCFGYRTGDADVDRPTASSSAAARPRSAQPAAPFVPERKEDEEKLAAPGDDDSLEETFDAVRPEAEGDPASRNEEGKILKPLFDFRKVYRRLADDGLVSSDPLTAKRLLLGLHERFYHAPITDMKNMLLRAGLSSALFPLAEEAVMNCSICRKHVRLPNRPQVKIGSNAAAFNMRVQIDLYMYKETWILLMVDEATRYKAAAAVKSRELGELLGKLLDHWFFTFGPPQQLVMDQESSLMSHEAGRELERFHVSRIPKGTTSGPAGKQHTGTGLVERHVGLMEITMQKLEAELNRQGIQIEPHDLAREAAMAHNQSLNYGGATPSMAVFGVLPRPFYQEDSETITAVAGALQTDVTPFEKALRIRQLAMSMVHKAVAEDRIARANRTRPHNLDVGTMVPGTSRVDFHREVAGDVGWRGPATLLKLNREEGSAILEFQGRPYLVSFRHIRPHQAGVFVSMTTIQMDSFQWLKNVIEHGPLYKVTTIGWVPQTKNNVTTWTRASSESLAYGEAWSRVSSLGKALTTRNIGGAMMGQGIKTLHPPRQSVGILLMWKQGDTGYSSYEHNNDDPLTMKKITSIPTEKLVVLYIFCYVFPEYEIVPKLKVVPPEGEQVKAMEVDDAGTNAGAASSSSPQSSSPSSGGTALPASSVPPADMDVDVQGHKRKGLDSRTVTIAPETKKSKLDTYLDMARSEKVHTVSQHNWLNIYELMSRKQLHSTEYPMSWLLEDNNHLTAQWDIYMSRNYSDLVNDESAQWGSKQTQAYVTSTSSAGPSLRVSQYLFTWPGRTSQELLVDMNTCKIYKVDEETDNLTEQECYDVWDQVDSADEAEIKQFVDTKCFSKIHVNALTDGMVVVDCVWVRKWKRQPDGTRKVKSRMCARGCFDKQKDMLSTRSTTATRLSQRILLSTAANEGFDVESWDVSGAFLKGLSFEKIQEMLKSKGIKAPTRKVAVVVPMNVWRHLAKFDKAFDVREDQVGSYLLLCNKPIYGLSDAPLAWQLCLHAHFEAQGGVASLLDENLFKWSEKTSGRVLGLTTTHVDDCGAGGKSTWLKQQLEALVNAFGKVTRQTLPFVHCGVLYSRIPDGFSMTQDAFCEKLKPVDVPGHKKDDEALCPSEVTAFRSILGGLLWLTATRLDLVADVCILQAQVTRAKIVHLRQANNVVQRAKKELGQNLGLHYRKLVPPLRLASIHDSSAAGNDRETKLMGGRSHILWAHGAKAKRISYSTSHAETLAAISGLEASTMVSIRLAELLYVVKKPTIQGLVALQERGVPELPVDDYTDCKDFFELASGDKSVAQDKNQRLYIMAFREARLQGRLRWIVLTPTESMTADGLTKSMIAPPLMKLLSTGTVQFANAGKHHMVLRTLPSMDEVSDDLFDMTDAEIRSARFVASSMFCGVTWKRSTCYLAMFATIAAPTSATSTSSTTTSTSATTASLWEEDWSWLVTLAGIVLATEWMLYGVARYYLSGIFSWFRTISTSSTSTSSTGTARPTTSSSTRPPTTSTSCQTLDRRTGCQFTDEEVHEIAARLDYENGCLRDRIQELETLLENDRQYESLQQEEARALRHRINELRRDAQEHRQQCPLGREIYMTATNRADMKWHANQQCVHIRGNDHRKSFRHCLTCAGT
ncbi:RE2 [Symbiodinium natans]|uniref:RE2 protein n=1 Tax=Symbiodinium natans TaxID=878477 RepID=A0A812R5S5_9DINO|nr:RE2 [Symbiodinium natans]